MPRQANGNYLPPANTAAVSGATISSTAFNTLETDIGTEITNSVDRLGRSAMQANLPMGGNKATGAADPTSPQDLATKNYVDTANAATFGTGDVKLTLKAVADVGWVLVTSTALTGDGTIGSASSGANIRANADCQPLFNLLFANLSDTDAPLLTSGGAATTRAAQTNAATAWAANCRIQVAFFVGRALGFAGNPLFSASVRNLGNHVGSETGALSSTNQLPLFTPAGTITNGAITFPNTVIASAGNGIVGAVVTNSSGAGGANNMTSALNASQAPSTFAGTPIGSASPSTFSIMQPTLFLNAMVKL